MNGLKVLSGECSKEEFIDGLILMDKLGSDGYFMEAIVGPEELRREVWRLLKKSPAHQPHTGIVLDDDTLTIRYPSGGWIRFVLPS